MSENLVKMCRRLSKYVHAELSGIDLERIANRIERLEAALRKMALDYLAAEGQAAEAYQAQLLAEAKLQDQTYLIEQLFALLDVTEETDEGRKFRSNQIRSSRALDSEKLDEILGKLKGETDA
jgi:hypothetical protein